MNHWFTKKNDILLNRAAVPLGKSPQEATPDPYGKCLLLDPPPPLGISVALRGGGMDIFWTYTFNYLIATFSSFHFWNIFHIILKIQNENNFQTNVPKTFFNFCGH